MANNSYAGFTYGGTQYNAAGAAAGYNPGQVAYPAVTNATYNNAAAYQSAAVAAGQGGYAAAGAATAPAGYAGYGDYSRAIASYDASKTYYQQSAASYAAPPTQAVTVSKTHYSAPPVKNINPNIKNVVTKDKATAKTAAAAISAMPVVGTASTAAAAVGYSNYDAALYSAATMYVAQQQQPQRARTAAGIKPNGSGATANNWAQYRNAKGGQGMGSGTRGRIKQPPRPQQLHYCEVCKISCAGPQTYREHLDGQKHKKREASLKLQASAANTTQNRGNNYHCELCDVTCTGTDAYAAHVRGAKHQKVVKLHQKLGKPIPTDDPKKLVKIHFVSASPGNATLNTTNNVAAKPNITQAAGAVQATNNNTNNSNANNINNVNANNVANANTIETKEIQNEESQDIYMLGDNDNDNIKPVGGQYIEEIKDEDSKILSFNCKLCDCKFNDPNAKEMHMKGRRHRLQYKRKVQPDLVVDFKPTPRQRRLAEARAQRAQMQAHRGSGGGGGNGGGGGGYNDEHDGNLYWDEQRRRAQYDDEYDYSNWLARSFVGQQRAFAGRMMANGPPPFYGMLPAGANMRRPESNDDRHAISKHAEIYPKEEDLQIIQRIVSHTERALKYVSDALTENPCDALNAGNGNDKGPNAQCKDGRDNQMLSFQNNADIGNVRILKGVMRVGYLAKGLLLQGDKFVELVVLCSEKPTINLLKHVAQELPMKLTEVTGDNPIDYKVEPNIEDSAIIVRDESVSVKISLTSPLLRETPDNMRTDGLDQNVKTENDNSANDVDANMVDKTNEPANLLPKEPCLKALAELRHAKWFQARATGLQSCVMVIRILRDLCQRVPSWQALPQWSLELLVEKVISSAGFPISPGDCLRRIMEALASGFLINGPGILDPCEKEPKDALENITKQQREDMTVSAQLFLRYIAFRQIYKVLGMRQLPAVKFSVRPWRVNRKRRRSAGTGGNGAAAGAAAAGKTNATADAAEPEASVPEEKIPKKETKE